MVHAHCKALLTNTIAMMVLLFSVAVASGQTQDIEGRYQVSGTNLGGSGQYSGEVAVTRTGDVYQVAWSFGQDQHIGTGILFNGQLSVIYQPEGQSPGIAVYQIEPNGTLLGIWTMLGGQILGTEEWTPPDRL